MIRQCLTSAIGALILSVSFGALAHTGAASPTVSAPDSPGNGVPVIFGHTSFDLSTVGYVQSEFFIEGIAYNYLPTTPLTTDGKWAVSPSSQAGYKTRMVVNRPIDDRDFNGTVIVEWLNVSGGADASPEWIQTHVELIRRGYVWIGVSAQAVGMNSTKSFDPVRYASLTHPGDSYSYDMFSQAGQGVRDNAGTILRGLRLRRVLAAGESQSAGRLVTYIDAVHPLAHVYDGFLVHSRSAAGAALSQAPLTAVATPTPSLIRDDLRVPVLVFNTETDTAALQARQSDSPTFRLWEAAGTAHFDQYGLQLGATDLGRREDVARWFDSMLHPTNQPNPNFSCNSPVNSGPQTFVLRAAITALNSWVAERNPPPRAPRFQTVSIQPAQYVLDANGNVRGGIRNPAVDAPVATLSGLGQSGITFCALFGTTVPFTPQQLDTKYRNHGRFVLAWSQATLDAVRDGFLLPRDAVHLIAVSAQSDVAK